MLGEIIAARRQQVGLTQEDLAEIVGVSRGAIAQIELGMIKWPRPDTLQKIAEALQTSITFLLREAGIIPREDQAIEAEVTAFISEYPEFTDLFELAQDITRENPEKLQEIVRFARWVLEEERKKKGSEAEG